MAPAIPSVSHLELHRSMVVVVLSLMRTELLHGKVLEVEPAHTLVVQIGVAAAKEEVFHIQSSMGRLVKPGRGLDMVP